MAINLTPKQDFFCKVYIETGNASDAYRRAYDAGKMKGATINRCAKAQGGIPLCLKIAQQPIFERYTQ